MKVFNIFRHQENARWSWIETLFYVNVVRIVIIKETATNIGEVVGIAWLAAEKSVRKCRHYGNQRGHSEKTKKQNYFTKHNFSSWAYAQRGEYSNTWQSAYHVCCDLLLINSIMEDANLVHMHNGILFSHEEKWNCQKKLHESGECYINWGNQGSERKITTQTKDIMLSIRKYTQCPSISQHEILSYIAS